MPIMLGIKKRAHDFHKPWTLDIDNYKTRNILFIVLVFEIESV